MYTFLEAVVNAGVENRLFVIDTLLVDTRTSAGSLER